MPFRTHPRLVLAENLKRLKDHYRIRDMAGIVAHKAKIGRGTAHRVVRGQVSCRIDTLASIARAFDLDAWQLLAASFDPANPPVLRTIGQRQEEFERRLSELRREYPELVDDAKVSAK